MAAAALHGDKVVFERLKNQLESTRSEHERLNILTALGKFRDRGLIEDALGYILAEVPARNRAIAVSAAALNPHAAPLLWDWYLSRIRELEGLHPLHYERVIAAVVPLCGLGREQEVRSFLDAYALRKESLRDVIALALERLDINARMRDRCAAPASA